MTEDNRPMRGFPISFNIYAHDEQEAEEARMAIIAFIGQHAREGRAVSARKVAQALSDWERNPIVRNSIIRYFT